MLREQFTELKEIVSINDYDRRVFEDSLPNLYADLSRKVETLRYYREYNNLPEVVRKFDIIKRPTSLDKSIHNEVEAFNYNSAILDQELYNQLGNPEI
jgi:hypothetical protein